MDVPSLKSRMISGVAWIAATKAAGQAITWAITIVVVRLLAPQDYGLMGMAVLFTGFLLLFNEFGLGAALVRERDLTDGHVSDLQWAMFLMNAALFACIVAAAPLVARWFGEPELVPIVRTLGVAFVINGLGAPSLHLLVRDMAFRLKSLSELTGNLAGGVCTLAFAVSGSGVWSLVFGYLVQQAVTNFMYCVYRRPRFSRQFSPRNIRPFLNFGVQVAVAKVLWYGSSNADFLVVGALLGTVQLGYYSLAFQFSSVPIDKIVTIVTQVAFPTFSALQTRPERLGQYYLKLVTAVALVTFPMFLGLMVVADRAVPLILGARWTPAILPLKVLCVVACFRAIETMNGPAVLAMGRPRVVMYNNLLQAVVMPLSFYAGARYGLDGVALAWLISLPFLYSVITLQTLGLLHLSFTSYLGALKHAVAGSLLMVAAVSVVQDLLATAMGDGWRLTIGCGVGAAVYGVYNLVFNRPALSEALGLISPRAAGALHRLTGQAVEQQDVQAAEAAELALRLP